MKLTFTLTKQSDLGLVLDRLRNKRERAGVTEQLASAFSGQVFKCQVNAIEHHMAHLSSTFHASLLKRQWPSR